MSEFKEDIAETNSISPFIILKEERIVMDLAKHPREQEEKQWVLCFNKNVVKTTIES